MSKHHLTQQATPALWSIRWLKALPKGGHNVRAAFAFWAKSSPEHLEAYLRQRMLDTELRGLDPERRIDAQALIARARANLADGKIIPWPHGPGRGAAKFQSLARHGDRGDRLARIVRVGLVAVALSVVVLSIGPEVTTHVSASQRIYVTAAGERQQVRLPDGSLLLLNAESAAKVQFTPSRREVRLLRGEALFTIGHDSRRPFYARVADTLVQDVGTAFDARVESSGATTVTVTHGRVKIQASDEAGLNEEGASRAVFLQASEQAVSSAGRRSLVVVSLSPAELAARIAWTQDPLLLDLDGMSLAAVVEQFNRRNRVQLRLADARSGQLELGGAFDMTTPRSFASSLGKLGCQVEDRGKEIVVSC